MNKRLAIYARLLTGNQTPDHQLQELHAVAERRGWQVAAAYIDLGLSGAKGREQRPANDRLYDTLVRREIDVVMAWSVDLNRVFRSNHDSEVNDGDNQL